MRRKVEKARTKLKPLALPLDPGGGLHRPHTRGALGR